MLPKKLKEWNAQQMFNKPLLTELRRIYSLQDARFLLDCLQQLLSFRTSTESTWMLWSRPTARLVSKEKLKWHIVHKPKWAKTYRSAAWAIWKKTLLKRLLSREFPGSFWTIDRISEKDHCPYRANSVKSTDIQIGKGYSNLPFFLFFGHETTGIKREEWGNYL